MFPETIATIRKELPETLAFEYYADRESPWILSRSMAESMPVAALKKSRHAGLLERPLVKPVVAACGGNLARADVEAAAFANIADGALSHAATAGVLAAFERPWHDFQLTFSDWGVEPYDDWLQLSRPGGNLVVQLGFPSDHAVLMGRYLVDDDRKAFECGHHPVRRTGRPTLAWARIDIEDGVALVEEVQSDWLRLASLVLENRALFSPRSRHLKGLEAYDKALRERYGKIWPQAMLLATLGLLGDVLGVRHVFMHQPETGTAMKHMTGDPPPRSLYSQLPKRFGFAPTDEAPPFLQKRRKRHLAKLKRAGLPLFWHLEL